jgi:maleylacetoacetate isomerase
MKLYGYWRSGTSYRVRLALALKGQTIETVPVNLAEGEHRQPDFLAVNPQGLVPTLQLDDGRLLSQSPAIIEYLDQTFPGPRLFPEDPFEAARVRQYAGIIGCDVHPMQNLRVLKYLQNELDHSRDEAFAWAAHWITVGLEAMEETLLREDGAGNAFLTGPEPTAAECYLLPQLYAARRFGADLQKCPNLLRIEQNMTSLDGVGAAYPDEQPDAIAS